MIVLFITALLLGVTSGQSGRCAFPRNRETSGRIYMDGVDCTFYYQCDDVGKEHFIYPCKPGEVFDPWRNMCRPPGNSVNCKLDYQYYNLFDQLCSNIEEGNLPMPGNPRMYISCWQRAFRFPPMECPHGTQFNTVGSRCDHADNLQNGQINEVGYPGKDMLENMPDYRDRKANTDNEYQGMDYSRGAQNGIAGTNGNLDNNSNSGNNDYSGDNGKVMNNGNLRENGKNPQNIFNIPVGQPPVPQNIGNIPAVDNDGVDFIGHRANDPADNVPMPVDNNMRYDDNNGRSINIDSNNVDPTTKGIDNNCIFDPFPGDCNKFVSCQDRTDIRHCGNGTLMSKSRHVCDYCRNLTDDEKRHCQVQC